jgi:hypothetical protein
MAGEMPATGLQALGISMIPDEMSEYRFGIGVAMVFNLQC